MRPGPGRRGWERGKAGPGSGPAPPGPGPPGVAAATCPPGPRSRESPAFPRGRRLRLPASPTHGPEPSVRSWAHRLDTLLGTFCADFRGAGGALTHHGGAGTAETVFSQCWGLEPGTQELAERPPAPRSVRAAPPPLAATPPVSSSPSTRPVPLRIRLPPSLTARGSGPQAGHSPGEVPRNHTHRPLLQTSLHSEVLGGGHCSVHHSPPSGPQHFTSILRAKYIHPKPAPPTF